MQRPCQIVLHSQLRRIVILIALVAISSAVTPVIVSDVVAAPRRVEVATNVTGARSMCLVADGTVALMAVTSRVEAISILTGQVFWRRGNVTSVMCRTIGNASTAVLARATGYVSMVDVTTNATLWNVKGMSLPSVVLTHDGHVVLLLRDSEWAAVSTDSGRRLGGATLPEKGLTLTFLDTFHGRATGSVVELGYIVGTRSTGHVYSWKITLTTSKKPAGARVESEAQGVGLDLLPGITDVALRRRVHLSPLGVWRWPSRKPDVVLFACVTLDGRLRVIDARQMNTVVFVEELGRLPSRMSSFVTDSAHDGLFAAEHHAEGSLVVYHPTLRMKSTADKALDDVLGLYGAFASKSAVERRVAVPSPKGAMSVSAVTALQPFDVLVQVTSDQIRWLCAETGRSLRATWLREVGCNGGEVSSVRVSSAHDTAAAVATAPMTNQSVTVTFLCVHQNVTWLIQSTFSLVHYASPTAAHGRVSRARRASTAPTTPPETGVPTSTAAATVSPTPSMSSRGLTADNDAVMLDAFVYLVAAVLCALASAILPGCRRTAAVGWWRRRGAASSSIPVQQHL